MPNDYPITCVLVSFPFANFARVSALYRGMSFEAIFYYERSNKVMFVTNNFIKLQLILI